MPSTLELSPATETHRLDRRVDVRCLCDRGASVTLGEGMKVGALTVVEATVRNISRHGVRLLLDCELPPDAILLVEPSDRGSCKPLLLARVLYASLQEGRWHHGCELGHRLTEDELQDWLA